MSQLPDLCLTLTPPEADAPEGTIANVEVRCDALGLQPMTVQPLRDPFAPKERRELEWYLETYWQWPYEEFAERGQRVEQLLTDAGQRLYHAVFEQAQSIVQPWRLMPDTPRQLSIISNVPPALSLPWELLCDEQGFLALRTKNPVSIIRRLPQAELGALPMQFMPPLRVLLVTARPDDAGFVDPRGIARELLDEVQPQIEAGTIALEFLRPPTRAALRERLSHDPPVHILHFDGHGTFAETEAPGDGLRLSGGAQGMLAFEKDDGSLDLAPADELAQLMQDSGVRLAVLTACQSAKGASDDLFSSVAARLVRSGVDAVVAMSASVLVASAARYVEAFYRKLAAGEAVTLAHERARQALHDNPERHLHQRRRDEAGTPIKLKDWWLPHFYLQRPVNFAITDARYGTGSGSDLVAHVAHASRNDQVATAPRTVPELPPAPRYGFIGRARELHQIERWLLGGSAVVVHGFGGMGKTAIAREAADWFVRTGMYADACFVSFEHGGDVAMLLSALGHQLGVDFDSRETAAALGLLRAALKQWPALVIADNLESILPGGEASLDAAARAELWDVLLQLGKAGAGVILTSRDAEFGDGKMAHGKEVKHLPLRGLHPEDGYALAVQLFKDLDIPQSRAPYPKLRDLLVQLDHHPLAIQLVLPALGEAGMTIDRISTEFAALLPRFSDDRETGRNRSLLASLEYSLRRLSDEERQLLLRLAPFEGGALEPVLLDITEIAESDWLRLRPALEQVALIRLEQIENFTAPFLRFHPVLTPYLRSQPSSQCDALRSRYAAYYYAESAYLYNEDKRNPLVVRRLAQCELPNLRRALELLVADGLLNEAAELQHCIIKFLNVFGLWRERDELRRRVAQAVKTVGERTDGALTRVEYLREKGLGADEFARGNLRAAYAHFTALLEQMKLLPAGAQLSEGSYEHCQTLSWLARCLVAGGQPDAAEKLLRDALAIDDALLAAQSDNQLYIRERGALLTDLGVMFSDHGRYSEARAAFEAGLEIAKQVGDLQSQGVTLAQLGTLDFLQHDYAIACQRYTQALKLFQVLDEPGKQAIAWHQLGLIAEAQKQWAEAERCYRASLEINERQGDSAGATSTRIQLASVAKNSGRPEEAEGWLKRALSAPSLPPSKVAVICSNLANLLKGEIRAERMRIAHLAEARGYAERALGIMETLDASAGIWITEGILADIAELEGDAETARSYRRRARESFAAFAGNRWHIDQQFGDLIQACAATSLSNAEARAAVEAVLSQLEEAGVPIAAIQHIWEGERDWHLLAEDLDWNQSLLVKRVLETIEEMEKE